MGTKILIRTFYWVVIAGLIGASSPIAADDGGHSARDALKREATLYRLQGNFEGAARVSDELKATWPFDAIGYAVNLNTLLTRLTWDRSVLTFDEQIRQDGERALEICAREIDLNKTSYRGYYHCGQAHFALSYLAAIRGNYYTSGIHGTRTIEFLEKVLAMEPGLVDPKMHLGLAYYYADNLPPYIKAFSKLLWFIPTGNSDKSLPYIQQVTTEGDHFRDVAKYLYADLLSNGDDPSKVAALPIFEDLVQRFPENPRFQLRYISYLVELGRFDSAITVARAYLSHIDEIGGEACDIELAQLWLTRAHMSLGSREAAIVTFANMPATVSEGFPAWAKPWFTLTHAQINDLNLDRVAAERGYQQVVQMKLNDRSKLIVKMAKEGLNRPYVLPATTSNNS